MAKTQIPSEAQAKLLARVWGADSGKRNVGGYTDPTTMACVKYGWLIPSLEIGRYPSGDAYRVHVLSEVGIEAIEAYIRERRYKRQRAA